MIQLHSMLDVADNTGAKVARCIRVLGSSNRKTCSVGDVIVCSVKKALPHCAVKKGDVVRGVVIRTRKAVRRDDGSYVRFDSNANDILYYTTLFHNNAHFISPEFTCQGVADRSGSGDCFMGGLIYGLYNQHEPQPVLDYATKAAFGKLQEFVC